MEARGYESITFKMKPNYTKRDLASTILGLERAFSMSYSKIETVSYMQNNGSQPKGMVFRIYFKNGVKL